MSRIRILTYEQQETLIAEHALGKTLTPRALQKRYGLNRNTFYRYVNRGQKHSPKVNHDRP